jgi:D-glycero-alpha-D-manno-heptose-7-phosphate kinase
LSERLLLFSTGQTRNSAAILRKQSADAERKRAVINSLHRLKGLAVEMRAALLQGRLDDFGRLLDLGWQEKKRLSRRISSAAIDRCYEVARAQGALGGKIVGAGGGGFLLLYCPLGRQTAVRSAMAEFGLQELSFGFEHAGAQFVASSTGLAATSVQPLRAAETS